MTELFGNAIGNFMIVVLAIVVVLIAVVVCGTQKNLRSFISHTFPPNPNGKNKTFESNFEYYTQGEKSMRRLGRHNPNHEQNTQATLVQKVDERRRTTDSTGHIKLYNEYYELIFKTSLRNKDGSFKILHVVVSKETYLEMPFRQNGLLTFQNTSQGPRMIRFSYNGGEIIENPDAFLTVPVSASSR